MILSVTTVKAFSDDPERGNPAVVIEVKNVDDESVYLPIVESARCSVAAVISRRGTVVYGIRFFYEKGKRKVPACGHATLAAAHVLRGQAEDQRLTFVNERKQVLEVLFDDEKIKISTADSINMLPQKYHEQAVAFALGIDVEQLILERPLRAVGFPNKEKLLVRVSHETLLTLQPNPFLVQAFCGLNQEVSGIFTYALGDEDKPIHARHFQSSGQEDLVCGVGSQALAKWLRGTEFFRGDSIIIRNGPGEQGLGDVEVSFSDGNVMLSGQVVNFSPKA